MSADEKVFLKYGAEMYRLLNEVRVRLDADEYRDLWSKINKLTDEMERSFSRGVWGF